MSVRAPDPDNGPHTAPTALTARADPARAAVAAGELLVHNRALMGDDLGAVLCRGFRSTADVLEPSLIQYYNRSALIKRVSALRTSLPHPELHEDRLLQRVRLLFRWRKYAYESLPRKAVWAGCSPAEPASASPVSDIVAQSRIQTWQSNALLNLTARIQFEPLPRAWLWCPTSSCPPLAGVSSLLCTPGAISILRRQHDRAAFAARAATE
jgi:hypothetical protein